MASNIKVRVKQTDGKLSNKTPISLRGISSSVKSIENIGDVNEANVTSGATIVYNANTDQYDIKPLDIDDLSGDLDLDFGTF